MPAAWISAGAAVVGAAGSLSGSGSSGNQNAASAASPFTPYQPGFASQLNQQAQPGGTYGNVQYGGAPSLGALAGQGVGLGNALNGQGFASQINNLVANPSSVYQTPQYQAAFGQGQNAVNATLAAQGLNASGNQLAALQNYGQSFGQNAYNQQLSQLSGLYGQSLAGNQQGYSQMQNAVGTNLSAQQQAFTQMGQLSGLLTGSPVAAGQLLAAGNANTASSISNGISGLATAGQNLYNSGAFNSTPNTTSGVDDYGFGSTSSSNPYGFSSNVTSDPTYGLSSTGYTGY
jgi:hypothetical protein